MTDFISVKNNISRQYEGRDVPWLLSHWAEKKPDHPFLIWEPKQGDSKTWSYNDFYQDCLSLAAGLEQRGIKYGDRVLVHLDNCPELLLTWYACAIIGAVAVTTNTRSAEPEIRYYSEHAEVVAVITQLDLLDRVKNSVADHVWIAATVTELDTVDDTIKFKDLMGDADSVVLRKPEQFLDVGIQFTSGTTSRPKAVVWTHANALWGGEINARHQQLTGADVIFTYLPLFHTNSQAYSVLGALWAGATVVLTPKFSATDFWPLSLKHQCSWCSTIPFAIRALLKQAVPEHYYRGWGTAVELPDLEKHFKLKMMSWWGMTETITHGIIGDFNHAGPMMSIGRPAAEYGIAVVDDEGVSVAVGETGHLLIKGVRGVSLFKEYLKNDKANNESFDENGWFRTGDRVSIGESGDLFFADRDKDMLKVGAENVAASEVEAVIAAVEGVSELAVVAKPHEMLDEVPVAFIIPLHGNVDQQALRASILQHCREQLADFKVPVEVHFVDTLPRSLIDKINKAELRKQLV
jgi:crotonobetaine/carnitine-CoA ligase